ncbi:hypothetical protein CAEBREN_14024 [Caenorhabditis brenneri]|uniref:DUF281 domain-containing protein n=1 Tax=Caenorhabditis brenneri TaxID=135651 RepID=G0NJC3_CAEBE|nr:hypothetical protein CAEBREN_14024 [Caenorhabditis brenneri]
MCKIDDIEPDLEVGQFFETTPLAPTGKCISTNVRCFQQGGLMCTSVNISSVTASGSTIIAKMDGNTVEARLDCDVWMAQYSDISPCEKCDVNAIAPTGLPAGRSFDSKVMPAGDGCITALVGCSTSDGTFCRQIDVNRQGGVLLSRNTKSNAAGDIIGCGADGMFHTAGGSAYFVRMIDPITSLSCVFTGCVAGKFYQLLIFKGHQFLFSELCQLCDITTIQPTGLQPGEVFESSDSTNAAGCTETQATCKRDDGLICDSIELQGDGGVVIGSATNTDTVSSPLTCFGVGMYTGGTIPEVTTLSCVYNGCKKPCEQCNLPTLVPTGLGDDRTEFFANEIGSPGQCTNANIHCNRIDGQLCDAHINIQGGVNIASSPGTSTVLVNIVCGNTGTYETNTGWLSGINSQNEDENSDIFESKDEEGEMFLFPLQIFFVLAVLCINIVEGCVKTIPPEEYYPTSTFPAIDLCDMCKIDDIEPDLQAGQFFESTPLASTGKCIATTIRCFQQGGLVCTSATVLSVTAAGSTVIATMDGNIVEARLDCEKDGMFSSGTATKITQLACEFTGYSAPCQTCVPASLTPATLPTGAAFEAVDQGLAGGCPQVKVTCKRVDTITTCDSVSITATGAAGTNQIATVANSDTVSASLTCGADKMYEYGMQDTVSGGCKRTLVKCKRTDAAICDTITVQATTAGAPIVLASATPDVTEATGGANCWNDGFYSSGGNPINSLSCAYNGRSALCARCDLNSIAVTGLPPGRQFQSAVIPIGGFCMIAAVGFSTNDNTLCKRVEMTSQDGVVLGYGVNNAGAGNYVYCGNDGLFALSGGPQVLSLSCVYTNCVLCDMCKIDDIEPDLQAGQLFESITKITQLACEFTGCVTPCQSCNRDAITPISMPAGTAIEFEDTVSGGCKRTLVTCKRTDAAICDAITVQATTAGAPIVLASATTDVTEATGGADCGNNGFYSDGGTQLTGLECAFDGCITPCSRCDPNAIAVTGLPAGQEFMSAPQLTTLSCVYTNCVLQVRQSLCFENNPIYREPYLYSIRPLSINVSSSNYISHFLRS